jgi:hypothetical protein
MYEKNYAAEWGKDFEEGWYYQNLRYWDKMASGYQFCAYAPVAATGVVCSKEGQITIGSSTAPVTVETKNLMDTPAENLQAMMDAARIFGRYPIDTELLNTEM